MLNVIDSSFHQNSAVGDAILAKGGGLALIGSAINVTIERCSIRSNSAAQNGGAMSVCGIKSLLVKDTMLKDNFADHNGGGIYAQVSHHGIQHYFFSLKGFLLNCYSLTTLLLALRVSTKFWGLIIVPLHIHGLVGKGRGWELHQQWPVHHSLVVESNLVSLIANF